MSVFDRVLNLSEFGQIGFKPFVLKCNFNSGTHGGTHKDTLHISTFDRGRLERIDVINEFIDILFKLVWLKAQTTYHRVDISSSVVSEVDLPGLVFAHNPSHIRRHSPSSR